MNKHIFNKIISYMLLILLIMYFVSGFAMTHQFGFDRILSRHLAHTIHLKMTIPFFILIFLHIFTSVKTDIKRIIKKKN